MAKPRVVACDDHPLFLEGLGCAVRARAELDLVGTAGDGRAALKLIAEQGPDLAVVELRMPTLGGIEVARAVSRDRLATRVVILSAFVEPWLVYRAIEAGAAGYLTKCAGALEIVDALVRAGRGELVLAPALASGLADEIRRRGRGDLPVLTTREHAILVLLSQGRSAPEVAHQLYLGVTTVKTHLGRVYDKLGVSDRAAAVATAMRLGLIE